MTRCNFLPHWAGTNNMQRKACLVLVSCCINVGQSVSFSREGIFLNHIAIDSSNYQRPHEQLEAYFFFYFSVLLCHITAIRVYTGT